MSFIFYCLVLMFFVLWLVEYIEPGVEAADVHVLPLLHCHGGAHVGVQYSLLVDEDITVLGNLLIPFFVMYPGLFVLCPWLLVLCRVADGYQVMGYDVFRDSQVFARHVVVFVQG